MGSAGGRAQWTEDPDRLTCASTCRRGTPSKEVLLDKWDSTETPRVGLGEII